MTNSDREVLRNAFLKGHLKVRSVGPSGVPEWKPILSSHRAEVPQGLPNVEIRTADGAMVLTGHHRVFTSPTDKVEADNLKPGMNVLKGDGRSSVVTQVQEVPHQPFMYDLTVADWHNFVVHGTQVVVSNSPDRNYRFSPPQSEGQIGCYNQVFGFIWEDDEIAQYLEIALWKWNMHPPATPISSVDRLCSQYPNWNAALLWGSLVNAAQALAYNWVSQEFNYSIGGISLDIERSSKYMDLKRNAEEQWDKLVEAKARTVKIVRGLKQPRFGRGVRSAFGPYVGRGILSPRGFVVFLLSMTGYWALQGALHANHLSSLLS